MRRVFLFIPFIICIVLGVFFVKGLSLDPTVLPSAKLGKAFPAFELQDVIKPQQLRDESQLKGEVRLVNVWATWCPTCKQEHSYLNKLARTEGVKIIGVNYKDERTKAVQWLKRYGDPYQFNVYDDKGSLGLDLGVYGAPETYIIDSEGIIRYRHVGAVDNKVWSGVKEKDGSVKFEGLKAKMLALGWNPK
jgi:cytochrome c biogenesis protein CcmG/thiol:disulfide interchange protein DsbE